MASNEDTISNLKQALEEQKQECADRRDRQKTGCSGFGAQNGCNGQESCCSGTCRSSQCAAWETLGAAADGTANKSVCSAKRVCCYRSCHFRSSNALSVRCIGSEQYGDRSAQASTRLTWSSLLSYSGEHFFIHKPNRIFPGVYTCAGDSQTKNENKTKTKPNQGHLIKMFAIRSSRASLQPCPKSSIAAANCSSTRLSISSPPTP